MATLPIVLVPDPVLKARCKPVANIDDGVRRLLDDMLETMYDAPGIGLSAPQVGADCRAIVCDVAREDEPPDPHRMINPEIVWRSDVRVLAEEGCLSIPEHFAEVERAQEIKVRYLDPDGEPRELEADGLLAACIQHEVDHLDGILFIDYLSPLRRNIILRKMKKLKRQQHEQAA